jgi:hypothetical protein
MKIGTRPPRQTDGVVTLQEILSDMRAHPEIGTWDDQFCAVIEAAIRKYGDQLYLSDTEILILAEMRRRLGGTDFDEPFAGVVRH